MLKQIALVLICFLWFGGLSEVYLQVKITPETRSLPKGFSGVDPVVLSDNLSDLLQKDEPANKSTKIVQGKLKGKAVYENLTTDDLFAFVPVVSWWVYGRKTDENSVYSGQLFRLINTNVFPEPQIIDIAPCGGGGIGAGTPGVSSREDLVEDYEPDLVESSPGLIESSWKLGVFHLKTTVPPDIKRQNYKGYKGRDGVLETKILCEGHEYFVPSPQNHYELAFVKEQPFRLRNVSDNVFDLEKYRFETISSAGIVAWEPNIELTQDSEPMLVPIFVTKLVPPYLMRDSLTIPDLIESKPHLAIRNKIYVDLIGIWILDRKTGKIVSKKAHESKPLISSSKKPKYEPVIILRKERHRYTDAARQKNIQGVVQLRVTFLASGQIGEISTIKGLDHGLTEQAIIAARKIEFIPAKRNGIPVTETKIIEYTFQIY